MCSDFPPQRSRVDVVDEGPLTVDLYHRQPFPIPRLELRFALEEWHKRIPDYGIPEGTSLRTEVWAVATLERLPLVWEP